MNTLEEIEHAIEKLPSIQLEELAGWLESYRSKPSAVDHYETWLSRARGAAAPGLTTHDIMKESRGES